MLGKLKLRRASAPWGGAPPGTALVQGHGASFLFSVEKGTKCFLLNWWPETGSISLLGNGISNLRILNGAESAKSARMPKRSCKSLAKFRSETGGCSQGRMFASTWP